MENIHVFVGWMAFISIGAGFPMLYLWASGKFVGQQEPPKHARAMVPVAATLGGGYPTVLAIGESGFGSVLSLRLPGFLIGSLTPSIVALQGSFEDKTEETAK